MSDDKNSQPQRAPRRLLLTLAALLLLSVACTGQAGESGDRRTQAMTSSSQPAGRVSTGALAELFPAAVGGWTLKRLEEPPQHAGSPAPGPAMRAAYAQAANEVQITATAGTPTGAAKGSRDVYREVRQQQRDTLVVITLPNGLALAATSRTVDAAGLEALLRQLDLGKAEALQN